MKITPKIAFGWILLIIGLLVIGFSEQIVFPGLERLVGIETIVGKDNVVYESDGSYFFTNPGAMVKWISSVRFVGILTCSFGLWISGIRLKFPPKKGGTISN